MDPLGAHRLAAIGAQGVVGRAADRALGPSAREERAGLGDAVRLLGFRPSVWDELSAADIALVPSLADETFGNTAVEAILAERPVIASDTSGLREAAAGYDTAELVRPGDAAALADAVERIADDWPSYRAGAPGARAAAERRHARERYDADILRVITGA